MRPSDHPDPNLAAEKANRDRKRDTGKKQQQQHGRRQIVCVCTDGTAQVPGEHNFRGSLQHAAEVCRMEVHRLAVVGSEYQAQYVSGANERRKLVPTEEVVAMREGRALKERHRIVITTPGCFFLPQEPAEARIIRPDGSVYPTAASPTEEPSPCTLSSPTMSAPAGA